MSIVRYSSDPHSTVKYVKDNLELIGDITSFQVYFKDEDIPKQYRDVPEVYVFEGKVCDEKRTYQLILRDDDTDREFWFSGANCGYGGSGPSATHQILQLLGVKNFDYERISNEQKIIGNDLVKYHDLNIIIFRPQDLISINKEKVLKVKMTFNNADKKYKAKATLNNLGYVNPLNSYRSERELVGDIATYYFRELPYSTKHEWTEYATNNGLTLKRPYRKIDNETIKEIVENVCYDYNAKFEIKML
jgi:hypothetical protein